MSERFFKNPFEDYTPNQFVNIDNESFIKDLASKYIQSVLQNTDPRINTNSRTRADLYVGLSGIAFMFLKLSQSPLKNEYQALETAKIYSQAANEILIQSGSRKYISLLSGNAGVYFVSAAINKSSGNSAEGDIKNIMKGVKIFSNLEYLEDGQDEMLVGRCGYLLGIQWLNHWLNSKVMSDNDMQKLAQIIIKSGRDYVRENGLEIPLMYQYHGREYLGAAHGISAILFSLLSIPLNGSDMKDVKATIDLILASQNDEGNFPSKFNKSDAELVHWCHGAPGLIYLMAKAYKVFGDQKYLDSCLKCGDLVWRKGLLRKGISLCHGIASSGYVHLLLYRLTNDQKHLYRALKFAEFLTNDKFMREARTPDRPFSLFEGMSGIICFLLDLLEPANSEFPFMNVFV